MSRCDTLAHSARYSSLLHGCRCKVPSFTCISMSYRHVGSAGRRTSYTPSSVSLCTRLSLHRPVHHDRRSRYAVGVAAPCTRKQHAGARDGTPSGRNSDTQITLPVTFKPVCCWRAWRMSPISWRSTRRRQVGSPGSVVDRGAQRREWRYPLYHSPSAVVHVGPTGM